MLKKHRYKIIAVVVVLAVLAGAWFWGGNFNKHDYSPPDETSQIVETTSTNDDSARVKETLGTTETIETSGPPLGENTVPTGTVSPPETPTSPPLSNSSTQPSDSEASKPSDVPTEQPSPGPPPEPSTPEPAQGNYNTGNVPDGRPEPVEPEDMATGDDSFTITLMVRCDTILNNMNLLNIDKHELVPGNGVIFAVTTVTAYEGESVFNVLQREMRRAGIHMQFRNTPIYNSAYIMGINNLYEFDVGEVSGWMYKVNGWFPNYGSSRYKLQPGDVVEWHYTCDLGRDLGEYWLGSGWMQLDD